MTRSDPLNCASWVRIERGNRAKKRLGLDRIEFRQGGILDQDLKEGTVFFCSLAEATTRALAQRLREIARGKKIRVISHGVSVPILLKEDWLRLTPPHPAETMDYSQFWVFES